MSDATTPSDTDESPYVLTPESFERAVQKLKLIEEEYFKLTGEKCSLLSLLQIDNVMNLKKNVA